MNLIRKYIIVDDDPFNNIICKLQLEKTLGEVNIKIFEIPEEGLVFIQNEYVNTSTATILFLDLNMATLTGWEFIEQYEKFGEDVKKQISVYLLSSSVDPRDKARAENNKYVKGFISKPLIHGMILSIAGA